MNAAARITMRVTDWEFPLVFYVITDTEATVGEIHDQAFQKLERCTTITRDQIIDINVQVLP